MNDLDREKLIDYALGRMSPKESRAFAKSVRADSELAHALSTLQSELVAISSHSDANPALEDALRRRFSEMETQTEDERENRNVSVADANGSDQSVAKSRFKRFRFIPKRVVVPRREEVAFIFKRASVLTDEERSRKLLKPSRIERSRRLVDSSSPYLYSLAEGVPPKDDFGVDSFIDNQPWLSASADSFNDDETFRVLPVEFASESFRIESNEPVESDFTVKIEPSESRTLQFLNINPEKSYDVLVVSPSGELDAIAPSYFKLDSGTEEDILSRFAINPISYANGRVKPVYRRQRVKPYSFDELKTGELGAGKLEARDLEEVKPETDSLDISESQSEEPEVNRLEDDRPDVSEPEVNLVAETRQTSRSHSLTREEVLDEIIAIFGQSARILQNPGVYLAVDGADDEENEPTVTAEDLRLAELLGHTPTAIERNEYYWETENDENAFASQETEPGLASKLLLWATAPPAYVGRAVIKMFHGLENKSVEYSERSGVVSRRYDDREPGRLIDVTIPLIAGVALAAGVVFPALKYVATEIFITVAESKVRKMSGNFTISPNDSEFDVIPFISEQILFPHYEAVEFGVERAPEQSEMESDGFPITSEDK